MDILDHFKQDGFVLLPDCFSAERMRCCKERIRAALADELRESGVLVGLCQRLPELRELHCHPRLVEPLAALLGPGLEFWSDKLVLKSGAVDYPSPWHQDWPYWQGAHKLSVWIALDDATPENGCLRFLRGSHHQHLAHSDHSAEGRFENRIPDAELAGFEAVTVPVPCGGAVIFHDLAVHSSLPNRSGAERWSVISSYRDATAPDLDYPWATARFAVPMPDPEPTPH